MKASKEQNFERELPSGYKQALYINAKNAKFGIIFNLISLAITVLVMFLAFTSLKLGGKLSSDILDIEFHRLIIAYAVLIVAMLGYIVLHELVHGVAYKALTREKLTFGMSWSCAFCGVPKIYTYRKTALVSVLAPFIFFTLILLPTAVALYFISPLYFLITSLILGLHLGGCSGDLYVTFLLLAKFKSPKALMRDTGPEQYFYIPEETK
ncbi:MAG: DUF3267 domain-containing protein [Ruminococcaceae bacterium]|nr:DUF3267 domain-containing protein [Oscillospiraceae bacterium]